MRKLLAIIAVAGLAGGLATTATAEEVETPAGTVRTDGSSVEVDLADDNPDPLAGYLYADDEGVCGSREGSHETDEDPACNERLLPA